MSEIKCGDKLEDENHEIWTVADVFAEESWRFPLVRLERTTVIEKWAGLDEIGPRFCRYRPFDDSR